MLDILPDLGDEAIRRDLRYPFLGMVLYLAWCYTWMLYVSAADWVLWGVCVCLRVRVVSGHAREGWGEGEGRGDGWEERVWARMLVFHVLWAALGHVPMLRFSLALQAHRRSGSDTQPWAGGSHPSDPTRSEFKRWTGCAGDHGGSDG